MTHLAIIYCCHPLYKTCQHVDKALFYIPGGQYKIEFDTDSIFNFCKIGNFFNKHTMRLRFTLFFITVPLVGCEGRRLKRRIITSS